MSFAEHRVSVPDGLRIYARDYAPQGSLRGVPVVCLHGLTRNSADFEVVTERIAGLGRRAVAIDARGRGKSDYDPDPKRYRPDIYVGDTLAVLNAIGVPRAVFLGTSMGGIMTMIAATIARDRIAAAILNDVGPELDPRGIARIAGYVGKSGPFDSMDELIESVKAGQGGRFPDQSDAFWLTWARRVSRQRADGKFEFSYDPQIRQAFAAVPDAPPPPSMVPLFEALAAVPVLLVRGNLSDLLAPEGVATMQRIKPDLAYAEVPRVGHAPLLEEPEAWNAIAAFLSRVD